MTKVSELRVSGEHSSRDPRSQRSHPCPLSLPTSALALSAAVESCQCAPIGHTFQTRVSLFENSFSFSSLVFCSELFSLIFSPILTIYLHFIYTFDTSFTPFLHHLPNECPLLGPFLPNFTRVLLNTFVLLPIFDSFFSLFSHDSCRTLLSFCRSLCRSLSPTPTLSHCPTLARRGEPTKYRWTRRPLRQT